METGGGGGSTRATTTTVTSFVIRPSFIYLFIVLSAAAVKQKISGGSVSQQPSIHRQGVGFNEYSLRAHASLRVAATLFVS